MMPLPSFLADPARLQILHELSTLGAESGAPFDHVVRLAQRLVAGSRAWVSLIDTQHIHIKAALGFDAATLPLHPSPCALTLSAGHLLELSDLSQDARVNTYHAAATMAEGQRGYVGIPLTVDGQQVGTLAAMTTEPLHLNVEQRQNLLDLALVAGDLLGSKLEQRRMRRQVARVRTASLSSSDWLWESDSEGRLTWVSDSVEAHTGRPPSADIGLTTAKIARPCPLDTTNSWQRFQEARAARIPFRDLITERDTPKGTVITSISGVPVFDSKGVYRGYRGATSNITERMHAQRAAREAEQLLADALESLAAGVMICDSQGKIVRFNAAWRAGLGELANAPQLNWHDTVMQMAMRGEYPDAIGREKEFVAWRLNLADERGAQHEVRWRDRWILLSAHRLRNAMVVNLSIDITDRKQAELALAEQKLQSQAAQDRLQAVLGALPDPWLVLDPTGRVLEASAPDHPLAVAPASPSGPAALPDDIRPTISTMLLGALESGQLQCQEFSHVSSAGQKETFEGRVARMADERLLLITRDLTQQRAAEKALTQAEERWKFALEGSGDGVWDWDARSNKAYYSPRWKAMLGYEDHEIGDTVEEWTDRIHPDDRDAVTAEIRRHVMGETPFYQSEHRVRHRDGHYLWILDRGKAVSVSSKGIALRLVGTHSDVTQARLAEQALRDKQAAELASHAKTQFLSRMSHEMRTPLNAVIGFAQLMRMSTQPISAQQIQEYTEHVLIAGQHLLALINDVLDLQKVEEGGLSLEMTPVSLAQTVADTLSLLAPLAHEHQIDLQNHLSPDLWALADGQRLRQVVLNIASNAIKYNHPGGTVRISGEQWTDAAVGPVVSLCIEDTGAGMTPVQMDRLFQPFERLGRETSTIEGTGLGLIIARSLTEAQGGKLEVSSQPGMGTRVHIQLQGTLVQTMHSVLAPAGAVPQPPTPAAMFKSTLPGDLPAPLRMLYVEDNRINAILFEGALRLKGQSIELRVAEDGDEAITIAREWQPEVLVLDAHLPGKSGFEVFAQLRLLPGMANVPAYMCSADAMPDDVQRAYQAGFMGYWTKPIDISAVLADIEQLIERLRQGSAA